jgi:hypothetical protein
MAWRLRVQEGFLGDPPLSLPLMPLLPRWRFMTDEAKALTKRTAVSAGVILVVLLVFRALVPWVLLVLALWWIWKALSK